jgi:hypothetical protein
LLRRGAIFLILLYQRTLSPLLGPHCRFHPSCSNYAREAFERRPFLAALGLTIRRLAKCHPFHPGGYDPLEPVHENKGPGGESRLGSTERDDG